MIGLSGAGLLMMLLFREIPMNRDVNDDYGLVDLKPDAVTSESPGATPEKKPETV
jgi:hypothetical protein